ncbi:hypothetical protein GS399_13420 [Pedobacter sp. HMF7647]|uniref:Uncharacterized protein n=1 Tax=Hufsiella arboris TaxID=2695275 RepID=A0A7K1YBL2_9SPHI|nr:hypothetical protein [Hufsiella arboris]MXV51976.1 hypothetical protein [Hufsiella arboris]
MLNELSLRKVNSKANAQSLMSEFVNAASHASVHGFSEIRLYEGAIQTFYQIPLWDDYNIDNWLRDNSVNDDVKDKFRVIIGTFPLFKEEEFIANEQFTRSEFAYNYAGKEEIIFGLGAAYIYNTLAISLISHDCWSNTGVPISHYFMKGDGTDDTVNVEAKNFFDIISFDFHLDWWNKLRVDNLAKSQELWDRRNEFFPHLEFSPEVEDQIKKLGFSKFLFQIIERLKSLNEFAKNWTKGNFDVNGVNGSTNLNISSESDATLKKYGTLRKFTIPGNGKEIFDLHIKTGDLRFHFFADPKKNKIYIGYIGKHLRTVLYK